jgi:hypothetical protein
MSVCPVCAFARFPVFNLLPVVVGLWAKGSWHTTPNSNHAETLPQLAGSLCFWPRSRVRVPVHFFFLVFFFFLRVRCSSFAPTWYKRCPAVCEGILLVRLRAPAAVLLYTVLFCERSHFAGVRNMYRRPRDELGLGQTACQGSLIMR